LGVSNQGKFYISGDEKKQENLHFYNTTNKRLMHSISMDEKTQPGVFGDVIVFSDDSKLLVKGFDQITIYDISDLTSTAKTGEGLK
jgi:hypothetical protein